MGTHERILVVEDDEDILELLDFNLSEKGYQVIKATDGDTALTQIQYGSPDLVVLDLMLPKRNGLEVCRLMHENPQTRDIPVIMLTAKTEERDIVAGLEMGAVDYVTKPFRFSELLARIQRQLDIAQQRRKLTHRVETIQQRANDTSKKLIQSERLASLGMLAAGITHEVNNVNVYLGGYAQLLKRIVPDIMHLLEQTSSPGIEKIDQVSKSLDAYTESILSGSQRINDIMKTIRDYSSKEGPDSVPLKAVPIHSIVESVIDLTRSRYKHHAEIRTDIPADLTGFINRQLLEQILVNLVINAADAIAERQQQECGFRGQISIQAEANAERIRIRITDNGIGMDDAIQAKMYDAFFTTKKEGKGTGLGLGIVKELTNRLKGSIRFTSTPMAGTTFVLSLPRFESTNAEAPAAV